MNYIKMFISSILAGIAISIGSIAYLVTQNAMFFPIGLFIVVVYNLHLFTGRVGYISKKSDFPKLLLMLLGNVIGAGASGFITRYCKPALVGNAIVLCERKLAEGVWLIPLAIMCNVLIFVAVDICTRKEVDNIVKIVSLWMATSIFVICGFEHCVANTFYFALSGTISVTAVLYLIANAILNGIGGFLAYVSLYLVQDVKI